MKKNTKNEYVDAGEDAIFDLSPEDFWGNDTKDEDEENEAEAEINPYVAKITVKSFGEGSEAGAAVYVDGYTHEDFRSGMLSATQEVTKILIARITRQKLETWPINLRPDKYDYLEPKYGRLKKITVLLSGRKYWNIPDDVESFDYALQRLPAGFCKQAQFGLGLKWKYRHIFGSIASIPSIEELLMPDDDTTALNGPVYSLGIGRFESLRRALDTIERKYQREALADRRLLAYTNLLTEIDAKTYPLRTKEIKPGALYELVKLGARQKRTTADRKAAMEVVQAESKQLVETNPVELMRLKTSIETVTLGALIIKFREMMGRKLKEETWRKFFESNPFILSLAFAYPVFMIRSNAFVGGTTLRGVGEKITDFLYKSQYTGNLALIEIKHADTSLLTKNAYRADLYGPDKHLASAISQVLDQKFHLQLNFASKAYESGLQDAHPYSTQCIVVIGETPQEDKKRKSFELFRNSCKDVVIVTFDELLGKLEQIQRIMKDSDGAEEVTAPVEVTGDDDVF
ncbi:Shedu immune nuclease family protein [Massilia oculi]|uniref:Shedu immune nuclease family protein n=1 Tax=Massilia oculi TaxID=945844 RepID=UPI0028B0F523|nr:Shedu immune nuclease family protein [Massilia oculi]